MASSKSQPDPLPPPPVRLSFAARLGKISLLVVGGLAGTAAICALVGGVLYFSVAAPVMSAIGKAQRSIEADLEAKTKDLKASIKALEPKPPPAPPVEPAAPEAAPAVAPAPPPASKPAPVPATPPKAALTAQPHEAPRVVRARLTPAPPPPKKEPRDPNG